MSSHTGIIILIIVGVVTVVGVIIIGTIEARRTDKSNTSLQPQNDQKQ